MLGDTEVKGLGLIGGFHLADLARVCSSDSGCLPILRRESTSP